jgi:hypothetical protein
MIAQRIMEYPCSQPCLTLRPKSVTKQSQQRPPSRLTGEQKGNITLTESL